MHVYLPFSELTHNGSDKDNHLLFLSISSHIFGIVKGATQGALGSRLGQEKTVEIMSYFLSQCCS